MSKNMNRKALQKLLLREFKMIGMGQLEPMGVMGLPPRSHGHDAHGHDAHGHSAAPAHGGMMKSPKECVSREDCCAAVMCLVECCSCPVTKAALLECCQDIMSGDYDH